MKKTILILSIISLSLNAQPVYPITKTQFKLGNGKVVNLTNKDFIYVYINPNTKIGTFYMVDKDGTTWKYGRISGGTFSHQTQKGVFSIFQKAKYHMSKKYPDPRGINNMDYMMKFTQSGIALHKGNVNALSHGCIHVHKKDVPIMFKWSKYNMKVVVSNEDYRKFAIDDLRKIYGVKRYSIIK